MAVSTSNKRPDSTHSLLPAPAELRRAEGRLTVTPAFSFTLAGEIDARVEQGICRLLRRWEERTGFTFARSAAGQFQQESDGRAGTLAIEWNRASDPVPSLSEDESYHLTISSALIVLRAPLAIGALRGLESLGQLLQCDEAGWFLPAMSIRDQPRFPWRGLMIDVVRHWQPMDVIKRNLEGMALVKLNVLHLHLTDDQGFRIESKTHPRLHGLGSDGRYFTQFEMRELIAFAADRGIRVVPEFDVPGHATSWLVAYPELGSAPGPYAIERGWGIFDPVLDPTNESTYALLDDLFGEMAALFPDPYFHIGGDENNGRHWSTNARIQEFIRAHDLKDNAGLHAHFNQRVHAILSKHGKRLVGWDEILHPALPPDSVVHSWRGADGIAEATRQGFSSILSNGYYLDLNQAAAQHYANDPVTPGSSSMPEERARVLGGEATMWSEWVSTETIDSRIWPRAAAVAERLWSPSEVTDVEDLYRRLAVVSLRLEEAGLNHERNRPAMIRRLAGPAATPLELEQLRTFVDLLEPVKGYRRSQHHAKHTQFSPLVGLADCANPESATARVFAHRKEKLLRANPSRSAAEVEAEVDALSAQLQAWQTAGHSMAELFVHRAPLGRAGVPVARALAEASGIALAALAALRTGERKDAAWRDAQLTALDAAAESHDAVELPCLAAIQQLVTAASAR